MNFANSVKKLAANANISWKFLKVTGGCKPQSASSVLGHLQNKNECIFKEHLKALSFCRSSRENVFFSFPKTDVAIKKSIIEPDQNIKVKIELPLSKIKDRALELPFHVDKVINEPLGQVIIKEAKHMIRIRKEKMKKHKKKKFRRKFKVQIETRTVRRNVRKENLLQDAIRGIHISSADFSAENYVNDKLKDYNWEHPVTRVRGRLAPDWVIKEHLEKVEEKKVVNKRVDECLNFKK